MLSAIRDLREVAALCSQGQRLGQRLEAWLAESLHAFLTQEATSLEEALGLRSSRGGVPWWREEAIRERDRLLREFAQAHFSDRQVSSQARSIHLLCVRYAATAWRFDRDKETIPYRDGTPHAWLFRIFSAGASMPISERHLRTILGSAQRIKSAPLAQRAGHLQAGDGYDRSI